LGLNDRKQHGRPWNYERNVGEEYFCGVITINERKLQVGMPILRKFRDDMEFVRLHLEVIFKLILK